MQCASRGRLPTVLVLLLPVLQLIMTPPLALCARSSDESSAAARAHARNARQCERGDAGGERACLAADVDSNVRSRLRPPTTRLWAGARKRLLAQANTTLLHAHPDIFVVPNLLSRDESDELGALLERRIAAAPQPRVCFSENIDEEHRRRLGLGEGAGWTTNKGGDPQVCASGRVGAHSLDRFMGSFKNEVMSQAAVFWEGDDVLVDRVAHRLGTRYGLPRESKIHVQIIRYGTKQAYAAHADCSAGDSIHHSPYAGAPRGTDVRVATALVYLDDSVNGGGATRFTHSGLRVEPQKGKAVLFSYIDEEGACQLKLSEHESVELQPGQVKRVLQVFYYAHGFSTAFNAGAEDEVGCDVHLSGEGSCRHYMQPSGRREAARMLKQGLAFHEAGAHKKSDEMFLAAARTAPHSEVAAVNAARVFMGRRQHEAARRALLKGWRGNAWVPEINRLLRKIRKKFGPDPDSVDQAEGISAPLASKLRKYGVTCMADLLLMTAADLREMKLKIGERNRVTDLINNVTSQQAHRHGEE